MQNVEKTIVGFHTLAAAHVAGAFDRFRSEKGQGAVEYAGIVFLVAMLIAAAITLLGSDNFIGTQIKTKVGEAFAKITG